MKKLALWNGEGGLFFGALKEFIDSDRDGREVVLAERFELFKKIRFAHGRNLAARRAWFKPGAVQAARPRRIPEGKAAPAVT